MKTKRRFRDAAGRDRCRAEIRLKDGSAAQCGRRGTDHGYCWQHAAPPATAQDAEPHQVTLADWLAYSNEDVDREQGKLLAETRAEKGW